MRSFRFFSASHKTIRWDEVRASNDSLDEIFKFETVLFCPFEM
jgi:hypothetical protein